MSGWLTPERIAIAAIVAVLLALRFIGWCLDKVCSDDRGDGLGE